MQAIKAGIMEIADIFVVNKADRDGADQVVQAVDGEPVAADVCRGRVASAGAQDRSGDRGRRRSAVGRRSSDSASTNRSTRRQRRKASHESRLRGLLAQRLLEHVEKRLPSGEFDRLVEAIAARRTDPYSAAAATSDEPGAGRMRAVLDHIGIAVQDVEAALAFYRDALGLEVEAPEDVVTQRVRARHIPVGGPKLELLEATAPDSAIAKYIEKRGPGLHHITLRVEDIRAALEHLKARGVRLVDAEPRPGAEHALVAFIHPSAAHGVLVELKQPAAQGPVLEIKRLAFGDLQLTMLHDGGFRLDGGAMFGVVPRPLWEKLAPADDRHRIQLAMRPLLVEADWGRLLVDCGAGDKMAPKQADIYALARERHLDHALADAGLTSASIDIALATHLHFDHFGGATVRAERRC